MQTFHSRYALKESIGEGFIHFRDAPENDLEVIGWHRIKPLIKPHRLPNKPYHVTAANQRHPPRAPSKARSDIGRYLHWNLNHYDVAVCLHKSRALDAFAFNKHGTDCGGLLFLSPRQ